VITYNTVFKSKTRLEEKLRKKKFRFSVGKEDGEFIIIVRSASQPEEGVIPLKVDDFRVKVIVTGK
jgi:hypothetical protein